MRFRQNKKVDVDAMKEEIIDALKLVYDPEIPVNIYDLGLIYDVHVSETADIQVKMTLTTPNCPVAQSFPSMVETEVRCVKGVNSAAVEIVWDPPWTKEMMSDEAKMALGWVF